MTSKINYKCLNELAPNYLCNAFTYCGACKIIIQEDPIDIIYMYHNLILNILKEHLSMLDLMPGMTFLIV